MPIQANVNSTIAFKAETTLGVAAGATGAQFLRRVSTTLATAKDAFASNEVRPDQQISDVRHGARSVRGGIEGELSTQTYDAFLEALLRGTWATGVTAGPAQFATGVTIADGPAGQSTLTFAGASSLLTLGFKIGDIVRGTGLTTPGNNATNLRIVALTATVMTVTPRIAATAQQAAGWTVAVTGSKLVMGSLLRSFTMEVNHPDIDISEQFLGCRIGGANINVPPNGMSTVAFDVMGLNGSILTGAAAPYFTSPTAAPNTGILSGLDGALRLGGVEQAVVTGLQINVTDSLSMTPVIGATISPDVFYGRSVVTGNVSAYLENETLINAFLNETEVDLVAVCESGSAANADFLTFNMQRVKLNTAQRTIGPDGGVIVQFAFQALLRSGGSGTAFDQSTLVIQRSN
jgi:hypothetical protein